MGFIGYGMLAGIAGAIAATAFVAYWSGVGVTELRSRAELRRLRNALIDASIRLEVLQRNSKGPRLSAAEIDAWHTLVCEYGDEVA